MRAPPDELASTDRRVRAARHQGGTVRKKMSEHDQEVAAKALLRHGLMMAASSAVGLAVLRAVRRLEGRRG
jgi:threonine synthase